MVGKHSRKPIPVDDNGDDDVMLVGKDVEMHTMTKSATAAPVNKSLYQLAIDIYAQNTTWELFVKFIKYLIVIRSHLIPPDIFLCLASFYFLVYPPLNFHPAFHPPAFYLLTGLFKLISLILFFFVIKREISTIKQSHQLVKSFHIDTITLIHFDTWIMKGSIYVMYFNYLWDIYLLTSLQCHGNHNDACASVTLHHPPKQVITNERLRDTLEVHTFNAAVTSNFLHILVAPIFVYYWNTLREKSSRFNELCKIVDIFTN